MRFFDFILSLLGLIFLLPVLAVIYLLGLFDTGSPIFIQERVGRNCKPFYLYKFRTMGIDTKSIASHLVNANNITPMGRFLRRTKLDELPQLWNVLKGDMSLVGPRPCLFNQEKLIEKRKNHEVFLVRPGITGLAQIKGIDMSDPEGLAKIDSLMIKSLSIGNYFKYIFKTVLGKGSGDKVVGN